MLPSLRRTRRVSLQRYFSSTAKATSPSIQNDLKLTSEELSILDPQINEIIECETQRQRESILLSPSSNYASRSVLDTLQTVLQNKYSEGYPRARYYGGNENVDEAEELTQQRALKLFKLNSSEWSVNVQSLGGHNAILSTLTAFIEPSSRIMTPCNAQISGPHSALRRFFNLLQYEQSTLNELATNYQPNVIVSGNGVDAPFHGQWDYEMIEKVSKSLKECIHICDISDSAGLIAAGLSPSPFEYADVVICSPFSTLRGPRGATMIFYKSQYASKIDGAVFPGHQGGPHNHAISAMAASLKMAQSDEFIGYQHRCIENANALEKALSGKQWNGVKIVGGNGHCVSIRGMENNERMCQVANDVNMEMFFDGDMNELRVSSNAMTTRGLNEKDFEQIGDFMDSVYKLSSTKSEDLKGIKTEIADFAKQFPLVGVDE